MFKNWYWYWIGIVTTKMFTDLDLIIFVLKNFNNVGILRIRNSKTHSSKTLSAIISLAEEPNTSS